MSILLQAFSQVVRRVVSEPPPEEIGLEARQQPQGIASMVLANIRALANMEKCLMP